MTEKKLNIEELKKKGEEGKSSSSTESRLRGEGRKEHKTLFDPIAIARELEECQKKKDEYLAGWQRERADFLNYKKEEIERIGEILKYAGEGLILKILPILDNFEIAEKKILEDLKGEEDKSSSPPTKSRLRDEGGKEREENKFSSSPFAGARENDENVKGLLQIKTQFQDFLKKLGVEEIKSVGEKFDPNFQEVIEEIKTKDKESGIIIEEIQKGYKLHGKVLRPAKVKIAK